MESLEVNKEDIDIEEAEGPGGKLKDKEKKDYKNLSLIALSISIIGSIIFIRKTNEKIFQLEEAITESKSIYSTQQSLLDKKKANIAQLEYIDKHYPKNDVEKTLFSFLAYIVNEANASSFKLDSFLVDYSSLNQPGNLVDIRLKIKGFGGSPEIGLLLHKIKQIKFADVEDIKLEVDEDLEETEGVLSLVITSKKTRYNDELADISSLSSIMDIEADLAGNWVKFETVKNQLRALSEMGLTADSLLQLSDIPSDKIENKSKNNKIEVELDGFEEIVSEPIKKESKPKPQAVKPKPEIDKPIEQSTGFSSPLKNVKISAGYSLETPRIFLEAKKGTQVMAMDAGRVVYKGVFSDYGECIFIEHSDGSTTVYSGLGTISVSVGQDISKGQVIATTGIHGDEEGMRIGISTKDGNFIDPTIYLE